MMLAAMNKQFKAIRLLVNGRFVKPEECPPKKWGRQQTSSRPGRRKAGARQLLTLPVPDGAARYADKLLDAEKKAGASPTLRAGAARCSSSAS
jgi:hypothetical protein